MPVTITRRDYSLIGKDSAAAVAAGLAAAQWYSSPIPRKQLKELMKRSDGPAVRDTLLWFVILITSGALGFHFWGTLWAIPCFIVYGVFYGSAGDSRWHECGHGTAFKTRWMNDAVYHIASFFMLREPTIWRWSHTRHHTDTIIVGRDPEIAAPRPPDFFVLLLNFFAIPNTWTALKKLALHSAGRLNAEELTFVPAMERWKVYLIARIYIALLAGAALACVWTGSVLPAMYVGLPTMYGGFMSHFFGLTQHAGLAEDVIDHRLNARTVYMNPLFRFIYWNMNYHVEHHMFPMVPYHALPRLHAAIKADCAPVYASTVEAYAEIIPTLLRQRREPGYFVRRALPGAAKQVPHNYGAQFVAAE